MTLIDISTYNRGMPAASLYFLDYDGNKLEFISLLSNEPNELGYVPYLSEWEKEIVSKKV